MAENLVQVQVKLQRFPEGVFLATSKDGPGLVARGKLYRRRSL